MGVAGDVLEIVVVMLVTAVIVVLEVVMAFVDKDVGVFLLRGMLGG